MRPVLADRRAYQGVDRVSLLNVGRRLNVPGLVQTVAQKINAPLKCVGTLQSCTQVHENIFVKECKRCKTEAPSQKNVLKFMGKLNLFDCPLEKIKWRRIVMDESQKLGAHTSQCAVALRRVAAPRRWCLSGRPSLKPPAASTTRSVRTRTSARCTSPVPTTARCSWSSCAVAQGTLRSSTREACRSCCR